MTATAALQREYRRVRARQIEGARASGQRSWGRGAARAALDVARSELELQAAEYEDRVRFDWAEYPEGHDDALDQDWETDAERERYERELRDGSIEVLRCACEVPARWVNLRVELDSRTPRDTADLAHLMLEGPTDPVHVHEGWAVRGALHGIDTRDDEDGRAYRREVERELAAEAGVIA